MALHLHSITFDAADPAELARFWGGVTGYQAETVDEFVAILRGEGSVGPGLMFIKVPEGKSAKNRMHVDLGAPDLDGETERVLGLGAELVGRYDEYGRDVGELPRSRGQRVLHRAARPAPALTSGPLRCERRDSNPQAPKGTGS